MISNVINEVEIYEEKGIKIRNVMLILKFRIRVSKRKCFLYKKEKKRGEKNRMACERVQRSTLVKMKDWFEDTIYYRSLDQDEGLIWLS